jgi:hypothetical protein
MLCSFVTGEARDNGHRAEEDRRGNKRLVEYFHLFLLFNSRLLQEKRETPDIGPRRVEEGMEG